MLDYQWSEGQKYCLRTWNVCMERLFWGQTRRNQAWERMGSGRCYYAKMGPCWIHCSDVFSWCLSIYFYDDGYVFSMWGPNILLDHLGTNFNVQGLKPELQREAGVVCSCEGLPSRRVGETTQKVHGLWVFSFLKSQKNTHLGSSIFRYTYMLGCFLWHAIMIMD